MLRPLCSVWNGTAYWPLWWLGVCCFVCFVGGFSGGVTPGPFPNPEAKPACADGTAPGRVWESRTPPAFIVILRSGRTIFGLFFHSSFLCVCVGVGSGRSSCGLVGRALRLFVYPDGAWGWAAVGWGVAHHSRAWIRRSSDFARCGVSSVRSRVLSDAMCGHGRIAVPLWPQLPASQCGDH
jgi:hypothetical protein